MLDKFFLKYERGVKLTPTPPEKTTFKKPSLIRVKLHQPGNYDLSTLTLHWEKLRLQFPQVNIQ